MRILQTIRSKFNMMSISWLKLLTPASENNLWVKWKERLNKQAFSFGKLPGEWCWIFFHKIVVCGGRLIAAEERKSIYSHAKYGDQQYSTTEDCDWLIQAPANKLVRMEFLAFEVEAETDCG